MNSLHLGRKTVKNDRDLVVFLIGARINKWWLLPLSLPILIKMRAMQKELLADPESGLMGIQSLGSAEVQYWRSLEHLMNYADDRKREHQPTAKKFYQKIFRNEAVGIWHEAYFVQAGRYECLYVNMPAQGLGKVQPLIPAEGAFATARGRLQAASG
jgi:hypothetical protein